MGRATLRVVDSSVVLAVLLAEADESVWTETLARAEDLLMAAPTVIEIMAVLTPKMQGDARQRLDRLLADNDIRIVPFDEEALGHALDGLMRFGRGRHPAKLNFGDCISYGLAKALDAPLLFKGTDFALTDVKVG